MTVDEIARAVELYNYGKTQAQIGIILGRDAGTISRNLKKAGVVFREYRDYYAFEVDESFFNVIDNELKAYWLGFLIADGCISKSAGDLRAFHFNLQRRDGDMVRLLARAIGFSGKIRDFIHKKNGKEYLKTGIDLNNKIFCNSLLALGWNEFKKHDNPTLLKRIPPHLIHHFIRGFFDGDGCVSRTKKRKAYYFTFAGSHDCLAAIEDIIVNALGFKKKGPKKSKNCASYRISWNGNLQVSRFADWLYRGATTWMPRKRAKFASIKLMPLDFDSHNHFQYPLSYAEISALSQDKRDELVESFISQISSRPWVAPSYSYTDLLADWRSLKHEPYTEYITDNGFRAYRPTGTGFSGRKILIHYQPHYWNTKYKTHPTIAEGWSDEKIRNKAVRNLFNTRGSRPSFDRLLRELNFAGARRVSHFHPGLVGAILDKVAPNAKSYLDPCAGWGARLLTAAATERDYTACDPNTLTMNGLKKMAEFINLNEVEFNHILLNIPFEEFEPTRKYDVAFTSPPYFNIERYAIGKQSYHGRFTFEEWYLDFLVPLIDKCMECCNTVALHVSSKIATRIAQSYNCTSLPVVLQRTAGHKESAEYVVVLK